MTLRPSIFQGIGGRVTSNSRKHRHRRINRFAGAGFGFCRIKGPTEGDVSVRPEEEEEEEERADPPFGWPAISVSSGAAFLAGLTGSRVDLRFDGFRIALSQNENSAWSALLICTFLFQSFGLSVFIG